MNGSYRKIDERQVNRAGSITGIDMQLVRHETTGRVLTVVNDGERDRSEVWIFASDRLDDEPVCRLGLPAEVVPLSFHCFWEPTK